MSNLVKYNSGLSKVDASIKVANKLLDVNNELPELIPYRKGDKWGYCDRFKKIIIPCIYDKVGYFTFDVAIVVLNNKYGLIDKIGKTILPIIYDDITRFTNISGTSYLKFLKIKIDNKYGFSNLKGSVIYECKYEEIAISVFTVEHIKILFYKNNDTYSVGLFDYNGNEIISNIYADIECPSEGISAVKSNINKKWGFIDLNGNQITPFIYDDNFFYDRHNYENINLSYFKNGFAIVKLASSFGVINKNGLNVIPCEYSNVKVVNENFFVCKNEYCGIIDKNGKFKIPCEYESIESIDNNFLIHKNSYSWIVDINLNTKIKPFKYDYLNNIDNKKLIARYEKKYGVIDINDNIMVSFIYDNIRWLDYTFSSDGYDYTNKEYLIAVYNGKYGLINHNGDILISFEYDNISSILVDDDCDYGYVVYANGLVNAEIEKKHGILDFNGNEIIPVIYKYIFTISGGEAFLAVSFEDEKSAYFDKNGNQNTPFIYTNRYNTINHKFGSCYTFQEHIGVLIDSNFGVIDFKGNAIIKCEYDNIDTFDFHDYYKVKKNNKKGVYCKDGDKLLDCIYDEINFKKGTYFIATTESKTSIFDLNGHILLSGEYESFEILDNKLIKINNNKLQFIYDYEGKMLLSEIKETMKFTNELICIKNNEDNWGIIDKNGKIIFPFIYDEFDIFKKNEKIFMFVSKNNEWGVIDINGNIVIPCKYEGLIVCSDMSYFVQIDDKWGYVDNKGIQIIKCFYDEIIKYYHSGLSKVLLNGKEGFIDKKGNQYWED